MLAESSRQAEVPRQAGTARRPLRLGQPGVKGGRIELPISISLSEHAADSLPQKRSGDTFSSETASELSFFSESIGPAALQHMIRQHFMNKIEVTLVDPESQSGSVIDLIKAIVFGFLYMKFDTDVQKTVFHSDVIRRWNRVNPSKIIDRRTKFNRNLVQHFIERHNEEVGLLVDTIVEPTIVRLMADQDPIQSDPDAITHLCRHLAETVSPHVWYVMTTLCGGVQDEALVHALQQQLYSFVRATNVSDALAYLVLDLLTNASRSNMLDRAHMELGPHVTLEQLQEDDELRAGILSHMAEHGEFLHVVWKFDTRGTEPDQRNRLVISIFNKENEFAMVQEGATARISMRAGNLHTYLKDSARSSAEHQGAKDTVTSYLSAVENRCHALNVSFDTIVHNFEQLDFAIINLTLLF